MAVGGARLNGNDAKGNLQYFFKQMEEKGNPNEG